MNSMRRCKVLAEWRAGRNRIGAGLVGSFLTCVAGTAANAAFDPHAGALGVMELVRRLGVGYAASASVVVLAFPLLQSMQGRQQARLRDAAIAGSGQGASSAFTDSHRRLHQETT